MKFQNTLCLISKGVSVDRSDGSLSIFKIISSFSFMLEDSQIEHLESEHSPGKPHMMPVAFTCVSSWMPEGLKSAPGKVAVELSFRDQNGNNMLVNELALDVKSGSGPMNLNFNMASLPIVAEGVNDLYVALKDESGNKLGEGTYSYNVTFTK